ncbi:Mesenchymal stem cell protein DSCD75 [Rubellimicrobium mesophilum DSM 19309]|uniref:Mesenchymal stem cell protein DSCD75 n=1 Tax=Rubellimicrobium mesophilum DSM 19309 TaxID=442562 RepID=A0A017HLE4_9RHOB|nr:acyl-CoA thioesterase [Rubellimicrobium mesophilum]EYD75332.1 Mesenchymal stem cell protein DSCD75 [Rubellimicrobium mesophilum DSM 19309]
MYPVPRLLYQAWRQRGAPLALFDTHVSHHLCWPWDLDIFGELNNGRALTLYDLGRIPWSARIGLTATLREHRWQVAVAGASVRYRRRVHAFDRILMRTRALGWDARFFYVEQSMRLPSGEVASHVLIRSAVSDPGGIVAPARVLAAMGRPDLPSPELPPWVRAWIEAEAERPWPPMQDA